MRINKKNLGKDKSLSFLLIFWDKENVFFCLYYGTEGVCGYVCNCEINVGSSLVLSIRFLGDLSNLKFDWKISKD